MDTIADTHARKVPVPLYSGNLVGYDVDILDVPDETSVPARSAGPRKAKTIPHSYLSVVDGKPLRHATWAECERRVKGTPGAKFKKAASAADEVTILRGWGVDPGEL